MPSRTRILRSVLLMLTILSFSIVCLHVAHIFSADSTSIYQLSSRPWSYNVLSNGKEHEQKLYHQPIQDDHRILESLSNNMGFYNAIDAHNTGYKIMNPTLLELPPRDNISHDFLIIARTPHISKRINGKDYRLARQVAMFANLTYGKLGRPVLTTGKWAKLILEDFGEPEHHCKDQPRIDRYIGPEDVKLFWTKAGEPLLIFTHQVKDKVLCQGQFIVDARAAVPELERVLGQDVASSLPSIRYRYPKVLYRQPSEARKLQFQHQREKNWAPVQSPFSHDTEVLFMVEPGKPFRLTSNDSFVVPITDTAGELSSIKEPFPPGAQSSETWPGWRSIQFHQFRPRVALR
ncbi:unnamed protein product [Fusarium langsethiae]|nr:unnamed protein product [Fusarium langsethiae]